MILIKMQSDAGIKFVCSYKLTMRYEKSIDKSGLAAVNYLR